MTHTDYSLPTYLAYLKERFPVIQALLFSCGYVLLGFGLARIHSSHIKDTHASVTFVLLTLNFFFFLLRQRVVDEFRDKDIDRKFYPHRPFSNGTISKKQLLSILYFAISCELLCVLFLNNTSKIIYILVCIFSFFMAKEFFIPKVLSKHFTAYFLSHEAFFIFYGLFLLTAFNAERITISGQTILGTVVLTLAPLGIEIIRKFSPRYDTQGKIVPDTYSTVWGRRQSLVLLLLITCVLSILITVSTGSYIPIFFAILIDAAWLFYCYSSDRFIPVIGAISFLGMGLLSLL